MSQHIYQRGDVTVRLGYDRPLDFVFCTIQKADEVVYSNLSDPIAGTMCEDVGYYRDVLAQHGITVPEEMFENVEQDQTERIGNKVVEY